MSMDQQDNAQSATERFRTHLRLRLAAMRDNAKRIGASSAYLESLDRSANAVLSAIRAAGPAEDLDEVPAGE